jgi:hypothetical protein
MTEERDRELGREVGSYFGWPEIGYRIGVKNLTQIVVYFLVLGTCANYFLP